MPGSSEPTPPPGRSPQPSHPRPDPADELAHLNRRHLLELFGRIMPANEPDAPACVRRITGLPHPFANLLVAGPEVPPDRLAGLLQGLIDARVPSALILGGGDDPAHLRAAGDLGFATAEHMCLMSVTPADLASTTLPYDYHLLQLSTDGRDDARFTDAFAEGYALPTDVASIFAPSNAARADIRCTYFGVEHRQRPGVLASVSMAATILGVPRIYDVATRPEHRGQGLAAHLTAEPLRLAWNTTRSDDPKIGVLQSSAMGEAVYRRIGFRSHGYMTLLVHLPAGMAH